MSPAAGLIPDGEYDEATDIQYYQTPARHGGAVLHDGDFVIVPPEDAHRPNCQATGPCLVRKIVVKVKVWMVPGGAASRLVSPAGGFILCPEGLDRLRRSSALFL